MPVAQPSNEFHALCPEHHAEMTLRQILFKNEGENTRTFAYVCTEPDCPVHYNISRGYFLLNQEGGINEPETVPRVRCPQDGVSMYLADINPKKRSFRLWKCPQCDRKRTNEEGLLGPTSQRSDG
jgi:hypothetical protein